MRHYRQKALIMTEVCKINILSKIILVEFIPFSIKSTGQTRVTQVKIIESLYGVEFEKPFLYHRNENY